MARLSKFSPKVSFGGAISSKYSASRRNRRRSTPATCVLYEDRSNFVVFKLKQNSVAGGSAGNRWQVLLYKVSSGRFSFRLIDPTGAILVTLTRTGGMANLMSAVNANATVSPYVTMSIIGAIDNGTAFASSITDYCRFSGGS
tara:strand:+ start:123 stop:551 length:429 start_codon:yes stop_codon:yes gene_type:complete